MSEVADATALIEAKAELERRLVHQGEIRPIDVEELEELLMAKVKAKDEVQLVAFRMKGELLERLDAHALRMTEASPGMTFTRSDAVRVLLTLGLDQAEKRDKR